MVVFILMSNELVLICEDDDDLREAVATGLKDAGMEVLTAKNGEEGASLALSHQPSLILMDIQMPVMDGHQAVQKIRADEWGKNAKVIYLTSLSDAENVVYAVEKGSDDYLVKPHVSLKELVNKVRLAIHAPD